MKSILIASVGVTVILGIGSAQANHGVVAKTHAGLTCYEFQLAGSPNWYAIPMIGNGYGQQASDISSARDSGKTVGFSVVNTNCSANSPDGAGAVPVPNVTGISIPPLPGQ
jgi:hypothetical protein